MMTRRFKVTGDVTFEVQVDLAGVFVAGYPATGPTYSCGGTPAEPDGIEDMEILAVNGLRQELSPPEIRGSHMWTQRPINLFEGVDMKSEAARKILDNILAFVGEDAARELINSIEEA